MTYNDEARAHQGNFLISNIVAGIKTEQKIGEIKLKVKKDVKEGTNTEIKIKNITSNDGGEIVKESDKRISIKIVGTGSTNQGGTNQGGTNQGGTNQGSTNQGGTNQGGTNQGSTNQGSTNQGGTNQGSTNQGSTNQGGTNQGGTNQGSINQGSTNQGSTSSSTGKSDSKGNLPYTGIDNAVKVSIGILGIITTVTYIKYRKIK